MSNKKISIITVNKNNKEGLLKTIASVVGQVDHNFEYIVIDGNSTDGSQEIIQQYKNKLDYWESSPDSGIYYAMNKGIDHAHGDYLLFLNSGDWLLSPLVIKEINTLTLTAGVYYCNAITIQKNVITTLDCNYTISLRTLLQETINHHNTLIQRKLLLAYGKYREEYTFISEVHFYMKVLQEGKASFSFLPLLIAVFDLAGIATKSENQEAVNTIFIRILQDIFGISSVQMIKDLLDYKEYFNNHIPKGIILLNKLYFFIRSLYRTIAGKNKRKKEYEGV